MQLYHNQNNKAISIAEVPFRYEKEIQNLFEQNLAQIMGLEFVQSEFVIKNNRIDTLAFDPESKSFVIIEYKRDKNYSVFDQGITYLGLMLEYKADFIVEYNERFRKNLKRDEIDWSQSRVAFVAPSFSSFQQSSVNFKDFSIELWEVKQYQNNIVVINPIKKSARAESIKLLTQQNQALQKVSSVIKVYTEEEHLQNASDDIAALYQKYKAAILNLADNTDIKAKKQEIGFSKEGKIYADICVQKSALKIWINAKEGDIKDPNGIARNVSKIGHWGNGDYEIIVKDDRELEYICSLIKQAIK
jgi:predicted transport protein